jgi:hypothetical protein
MKCIEQLHFILWQYLSVSVEKLKKVTKILSLDIQALARIQKLDLLNMIWIHWQ